VKNVQTFWNQVFISGGGTASQAGDGAAPLHRRREGAEELEEDNTEAIHVAFEVDLQIIKRNFCN